MKQAGGQRFWIGLFALSSIAGCVNVTVDRQSLERRYFVLNVAPESLPAGSNRDGVLRISNVRVSPRYDGKGFVYRTADMSYETDYYNQFLVPPGAMLTDELQQALAHAQVFRYVVDSVSQLEATHRLEGNVEGLYGNFSDKTAPQAVLAISFLLSREAAAGSEVIFQKSYRRVIALQRRTPEALVRGWNEGLAAILTSVITDLKPAVLQDRK